MMTLRKRPNPNRNLLRGMRCPQCGNHYSFQITVTAQVNVTDQGYEEMDSQAKWDDSSPCACRACQFEGTVLDFKRLH